MSPSASMLFLSYHQLHGPAPRKPEEAVSPAGGLLRFSVLSFGGAIARRLEAPLAEGTRIVGCKRDDAVEDKSAAADLEEKFEEALRLSCWSS